MRHEKLIAKAFYIVTFKNVSPISVGNDLNIVSEHDTLKSEGVPFIPGTSIAGVISHYARENGLTLLDETQKGDEFAMSRVIYSDAKLVSKHTTPIREGVALNNRKTSIDGALYDYEVIDTGASFELRIEVTLRENDESSIEEYDVQIKDVLSSFNNGDIVVGFKSNRGFGRLETTSVLSKVFVGDTLKNLLDFDSTNKSQYEEIKLEEKDNSSIIIKMPIEIKGGISIRKYSTNVGEPDFVNLTANGNTVIPGTSFAGLLRHRVQFIAKELNLGELGDRIDQMLFGSRQDVQDGALMASKVRTTETILKDGHELEATRSAVNRFSGGSLNTALFKERTYIGGKGVVEVLLPKDTEECYIGVILLAMADIAKGYAPVGGEVSIGRGIIKSDEITVNGILVYVNGEFNDISYLQKLASFIKKGGN